uniref:Secreted protein n=1 Tax=Cyprinus carpio TaxID=7962 RepID=A0A8C2GP83_CYPCA
MPIWSITCCQFISLILMIRSAIPFTSSKRSSGVLRMAEAMRAPFMGGLEPMFLYLTAQASRSISPLAKPW